MKRKMCMLVALLAIVITVANIGFVIKDSFYYSLNNLPTGTPIPSMISEYGPNYVFSEQQYLFDSEKGGYYIRFYEVAETRHNPAGIRAEVCRDVTGERRTIYWQINEKATEITWLDYTVVTINGVTIDFSADEEFNSYDCRNFPNYQYTPDPVN